MVRNSTKKRLVTGELLKLQTVSVCNYFVPVKTHAVIVSHQNHLRLLLQYLEWRRWGGAVYHKQVLVLEFMIVNMHFFSSFKPFIFPFAYVTMNLIQLYSCSTFQFNIPVFKELYIFSLKIVNKNSPSLVM